MARLLGISRGGYSQAESGARPTRATLENLAWLLGRHPQLVADLEGLNEARARGDEPPNLPRNVAIAEDTGVVTSRLLREGELPPPGAPGEPIDVFLPTVSEPGARGLLDALGQARVRVLVNLPHQDDAVSVLEHLGAEVRVASRGAGVHARAILYRGATQAVVLGSANFGGRAPHLSTATLLPLSKARDLVSQFDALWLASHKHDRPSSGSRFSPPFPEPAAFQLPLIERLTAWLDTEPKGQGKLVRVVAGVGAAFVVLESFRRYRAARAKPTKLLWCAKTRATGELVRHLAIRLGLGEDVTFTTYDCLPPGEHPWRGEAEGIVVGDEPHPWLLSAAAECPRIALLRREPERSLRGGWDLQDVVGGNLSIRSLQEAGALRPFVALRANPPPSPPLPTRLSGRQDDPGRREHVVATVRRFGRDHDRILVLAGSPWAELGSIGSALQEAGLATRVLTPDLGGQPGLYASWFCEPDKETRVLLATPKMLAGVDLQGMADVQVLATHIRPELYQQALGRALRSWEGAKPLIVVDASGDEEDLFPDTREWSPELPYCVRVGREGERSQGYVLDEARWHAREASRADPNKTVAVLFETRGEDGEPSREVYERYQRGRLFGGSKAGAIYATQAGNAGNRRRKESLEEAQLVARNKSLGDRQNHLVLIRRAGSRSWETLKTYRDGDQLGEEALVPSVERRFATRFGLRGKVVGRDSSQQAEEAARLYSRGNSRTAYVLARAPEAKGGWEVLQRWRRGKLLV
jgi:transcriptional regulator with XRE-family HTH domain